MKQPPFCLIIFNNVTDTHMNTAIAS